MMAFLIISILNDVSVEPMLTCCSAIKKKVYKLPPLSGRLHLRSCITSFRMLRLLAVRSYYYFLQLVSISIFSIKTRIFIAVASFFIGIIGLSSNSYHEISIFFLFFSWP